MNIPRTLLNNYCEVVKQFKIALFLVNLGILNLSKYLFKYTQFILPCDYVRTRMKYK